MHPRSTSQISSLICGAVIAASFMPAVVHAQATAKTAKLTPALLATRTALDKYKDPMQAVRDGYFSTVACIEFHGEGGHDHMDYKPGAMGVHFLNPATIGPKPDSTKPQVLLYEPVGDKLVLVGAEWFVPVAISKTAPTLFGQTMMGPMEGHQPIMTEDLHHWDLHVWLWKDNPNGVFNATNPSVKCPKTGYGYSFDDHPPKIVKP
jgi:hypothetical protein